MTTEMLAEYGRIAVRLSEEEPHSERDDLTEGWLPPGEKYVHVAGLNRTVSTLKGKVNSVAVVVGSRDCRLIALHESFYADDLDQDPLLFFDRLLRKPVIPSYPKFYPDLR